ncbi:hypothetical protein [Alienimonas sp. DA493]|uniref:hypothetical protein n=1 Tax=Alienimonas sp. DA493 TaxID=3373605 RepID=UPI00375526B9
MPLPQNDPGWYAAGDGIAAIKTVLRISAEPAGPLKDVASVTGDVQTDAGKLKTVQFDRHAEGDFRGETTVGVQSLAAAFDEMRETSEAARSVNLMGSDEDRKKYSALPSGTSLDWAFTPKAVTLEDGTVVLWPN